MTREPLPKKNVLVIGGVLVAVLGGGIALAVRASGCTDDAVVVPERSGRDCKVGCPCGNTCIDCSKTCHEPAVKCTVGCPCGNTCIDCSKTCHK